MANDGGAPRKVLLLISSAGRYGAESMVLNLAKGLSALGIEPILGAFLNQHRSNFELAEAAAAEHIKVEMIACKGRIDRSAVRRLRELAVSGGIEVVHAHGYKADIYSYFAFRSSSVAMLSTCHNWIEADFFTKIYGVLDRLVLSRFHSVIAVSEAVAARLRSIGVKEKNLSIINNGIDLAAFTGHEPMLKKQFENCLLVGLAARLSPEKGIDHFLHAAAMLKKSFPAVRYVVIGDGPERGHLEDLAKSLGLEADVFFLGRRGDMPEVYASLDIFVLSSLDEGLPMTVLEAAASTCAVIATKVGAIPKVITDREHGLLVPPGNANALAEAIRTLLADERYRHALAENGRRNVALRFSAQAMAERYAKLYQPFWRSSNPQAMPAGT